MFSSRRTVVSSLTTGKNQQYGQMFQPTSSFVYIFICQSNREQDNLNVYVRTIMQIDSYCCYLCLSSLEDALNRHIYCDNSFIDSSTAVFFFDNYDVKSLKSMAQARRMATW